MGFPERIDRSTPTPLAKAMRKQSAKMHPQGLRLLTSRNQI
jgi:hypothetical protein